jgi:hypothetical protein
MKINQIRYNIRNQIKIARPDQKDLSDRQIDFMIDYIREKLLVQHLEKNRSISSTIKQDIPKMEVVRVAMVDGSISKSLYVTKDPIPQPIELNQKDGITYVGGTDKLTPIPFTTRSRVEWNKYNKYTGKNELSYLDDSHIYIHNCKNPNLKYITVEGIFLHPTEVPGFDADINDYPLTGRFVDMLNELIKSKELNMYLQIQEDSTNNADSKS